jgi:hypothetical protein
MDLWRVLLFAGKIGDEKLVAKEKQQEITKRTGSITMLAVAWMKGTTYSM